MRKKCETIVFIWDDSKALAFTRHLNRMAYEGSDAIAFLDGARIEVTLKMDIDSINNAVDLHNLHCDELNNRPIETGDITWRYADFPLTDLYLTMDKISVATRLMDETPSKRL